MTQYIGARLPAHATSTGKVLLAFQSQDSIGTLNLKSLPTLTPHTVVTPQALIQNLSKIREAGFGYTQTELEIGIVGIAVPIFDHHGEAIAALSVAGPASRISDEKLETFSPILSKAAATISHKIGYRGPKSL